MNLEVNNRDFKLKKKDKIVQMTMAGNISRNNYVIFNFKVISISVESGNIFTRMLKMINLRQPWSIFHFFKITSRWKLRPIYTVFQQQAPYHLHLHISVTKVRIIFYFKVKILSVECRIIFTAILTVLYIRDSP